MPESRRRVVFVGGGHAHLYALRRTEQLVREGAEVLLVGPDRHHYYSGMGPGLLGGTYRPEQVRVDVERLVTRGGGRFLRDRVVRVDAPGRTLLLESGASAPYDLASFNTGSRVTGHGIPGAGALATPVKPVENLERARRRLLSRAGGAVHEALVVGGGPAGVELAGNLWRLFRGTRGRVTLLEASPRLLPGLPPRAGRLAERSLTGRGVQVRTGFRLAGLEPGAARGEGGEAVPFHSALLATGIAPHPLYRDSGLPTSEDGGLAVNRFLQSPAHPELFGGGDCVSLEGRRLPRVGVYAVRQAPVLFRNLSASLAGRPLEAFAPQRRYLLVLNLGDGTGLAVWGRLAARGRWAFAWKNRLDTSFMAKYQES